ncbi:hypothetical protein K435DRAFT_867854 [Dendrothele bispora CBS 962.96]|uniref:Uncharacterized protein n=1 Tax=Dendrothele bispora (strain CBS 962.96) TaxID=1314807 RepID=A0A4S8LD86_DENBC|nr:hypothetical protein K435DRAFT_867854 [Dendrothele bispora CBS 962.96]
MPYMQNCWEICNDRGQQSEVSLTGTISKITDTAVGASTLEDRDYTLEQVSAIPRSARYWEYYGKFDGPCKQDQCRISRPQSSSKPQKCEIESVQNVNLSSIQPSVNKKPPENPCIIFPTPIPTHTLPTSRLAHSKLHSGQISPLSTQFAAELGQTEQYFEFSAGEMAPRHAINDAHNGYSGLKSETAPKWW